MAEADHTRSGQREANIRRVHLCLMLHPRNTAAELAAILDMEVVEVRRRLSDLKGTRGRGPRARRCDMRLCTIARRQCATWEAC